MHRASLLQVLAALLFSLVALAAEARSEGCWVDLFDEPEFKGLQVRLEGPVDLPSLKGLEGHDWNDVIDSLEVGPGAKLTVYRNEDFQVSPASVNHPDAIQKWNATPEDFRSSIQSFSAGQSIHHLGEFNLHNQISSLQLKCVTRNP